MKKIFGLLVKKCVKCPFREPYIGGHSGSYCIINERGYDDNREDEISNHKGLTFEGDFPKFCEFEDVKNNG